MQHYPSVLRIDLAKRVFHLMGMDDRGRCIVGSIPTHGHALPHHDSHHHEWAPDHGHIQDHI